MSYFRLPDQRRAIAADWTSFQVVSKGSWWTIWEGVLTPRETSYRVQVTLECRADLGWAQLTPKSFWPRVKVLTPRLQPIDGKLPHVYLNEDDPPSSRLCLHLPDLSEWAPGDPLSETILPWTSLWLYCYEIWRETGGRHWIGSGVHVGDPEYEEWKATKENSDPPAEVVKAGRYTRAADNYVFRRTGTFVSSPLMAAASEGFIRPPSWRDLKSGYWAASPLAAASTWSLGRLQAA